MNILDEIAERFAVTLDSSLRDNADYARTYAMIHEFSELKLSATDAEELEDLVGRLASAVFTSSTTASMQLGAQIAVALLCGEVSQCFNTDDT